MIRTRRINGLTRINGRKPPPVGAGARPLGSGAPSVHRSSRSISQKQMDRYNQYDENNGENKRTGPFVITRLIHSDPLLQEPELAPYAVTPLASFLV